MNQICTNKYITEIKKTIADKIKMVKRPNQLLESKQLYNDTILQIYQDAFETLIQYSVTFSTLLRGIKFAYENALQVRDERISQFITRDKIFGISSKKKERDDEVQMLSNDNSELKNLNDKLTLETIRLKTELNKLQINKFSEYLSLMKERDARYSLYHANLALELKMKQMMNSADSNQFCEEHEDPVILRIALDRCREQLAVAQNKLKRMTDEYSDTVPRREYDALENKQCEIKKKLHALRIEFDALETSYRRLAVQKKSLREELEEIKEKCRELERAGTPRPQWELCADFIGGGRDRWRQLARGLSSKDILMVLLKELGPAAETEHLEHFDGLGTDPAIPPYLRYEGKVRNLRLSRREIRLIISDIWRSKQQNAREMPMQDFVTKYFEDRYQQASVRAEWAYNLCAGAEQMLDEPQVRLFWGVLLGQLSEHVHWAHRAQWQALRDSLHRHARDGETITLEEFEKVAKATLPLKSEVEIKNLSDVVRQQLKLKINQNIICLEKLFLENEEGFERLDLARELFRQRQLAQDKYIREVVAELGGRRASKKMISVDRLKHAFAIVDPAIDHVRMERNIRWAFSDQTSELSSICPISLRNVAARLAAGNVERAGPRHKGVPRRTFYK